MRPGSDSAQRETSQILAKVFGVLRSDGIGKDELAMALQIEPREIEGLVFGLTLVSIGGGNSKTTPSRANLRVVE